MHRSHIPNRSLSLVLPVHNAQATLAADVARVLDLLPEVARRFDVLVIDDGSTDATCEIAQELAAQYPQVKLLRHAKPKGIEAAWNVGLARSDAAIVLGHSGQPGIDPTDVVRLLRQPVGVEPAQVATAAAVVASRSRFQRWLADREIPVNPVPAVGDFSLLRNQVDSSVIAAPAERRRVEQSHEISVTSTAAVSSAPVQASRPRFLRRLKDFALGQ